jgi:hypothetical protein
MNAGPDPYAGRKELTFEAEGVEPLPTQLVVLRQVRPVPPPGVRGPLPVLRRCHQEFEVLRGHCFVTGASANLPQAVIKLASHPFDL